MATLFSIQNGVVGTLVPTETWAAPNGMFGATPDRNDSSAYSWANSTSTVTLPSSALADGYLFLWGYETEDSSNGRYNPQGRMVQASGTGTFVSAQTGGYSRDTSEDRAYVSGWSFVDNPSASSTYQFQWKRDSDAPNTTDGTVRSFLQVVPFYYSDIGLYTSSTAALYGGTTPNLMTGFSGTDGTNITIASNVVSVTGDNARYLILGGGFQEDVGSGTRTQRWYGLEIDGTFDDAAKGCMYYRNTSNDEGGESFMRMIETVTATRTIEMNCYTGNGVGAGQGGADSDGTGTPTNAAHALVVIELNSSAEVFSSIDSVGGQEFALTGPVDVDIASTGDIEFNDSASFTRSTDIAVDCASAMDVLAFANVSHAREAGSIGSGSRWTVFGEFTINGTEQTDVGFHGNYNRGNQATQDTHGSSCNMAGVFAVTAGQDIGVSQTELPGTEGGNGDIESQPGWVGFGLINLDTLAAGGDTTVNAATEALTLTTQPATISLDVNIGASVAALALTTFGASVSLDTNVAAAAEALTLNTFPASIVYDVGVNANTEALTLTTQQATVSLDVDIQANQATLTLTEQPASVALDVDIAAGTAPLTLTPQAATVVYDVDILASPAALTLTTYPASLAADTEISASVVALSLTEYQASIALDVDISASTEALTVTTFPAAITSPGSDVNVNAAVAPLSLTTYPATALMAPRVYLNTTQTLAGATELTVTDYALDGTSVTFDDPAGAPTGNVFLAVQNTNTGEVGWIAVTVTTGTTNVNAGVINLSLTEFQASISLDVDVSANTYTLTVTEYPASISLDRDIAAAVNALTLTTQPATVVYDVTVNAASVPLTLTTYPAALDESVNVFAGTAGLTLTEYPATITYDVNVSAQAAALTLTTYPASLSASTEVAAGVVGLNLTTYPAAIEADRNIDVATSALTLTTYPADISLAVVTAGGGGGSWDAKLKPSKVRPSLVGVKLRSQPFEEDIEEEILAEVEEVLEDIEEIEAAGAEPFSAQEVSTVTQQRLQAREGFVRRLRRAEKLSEKAALLQLERRVNELARTRRAFHVEQETEGMARDLLIAQLAKRELDDIKAILFILGEVV